MFSIAGGVLLAVAVLAFLPFLLRATGFVIGASLAFIAAFLLTALITRDLQTSLWLAALICIVVMAFVLSRAEKIRARRTTEAVAEGKAQIAYLEDHYGSPEARALARRRRESSLSA